MSAEATHIAAYTLTAGVVIVILVRRKSDRTMTGLLLLGVAGVPTIYAVTGHEPLRLLGGFALPVTLAIVAGLVTYVVFVLLQFLREDDA